jgi:chaperonin cofactor prefoldin
MAQQSERSGLRGLFNSPRNSLNKAEPYRGFAMTSRQSAGGDSHSHNSPDKQTNASSNGLPHMQFHFGGHSTQTHTDGAKRMHMDKFSNDSSSKIDEYGRLMLPASKGSHQLRSSPSEARLIHMNGAHRKPSLEVIHERKGQPLHGDESVADDEFIRSLEGNENVLEDEITSNQIKKIQGPAFSLNSVGPSAPLSQNSHPNQLITGKSSSEGKDDAISILMRDPRFSNDAGVGKSISSMRDTLNCSHYSPRKSAHPSPVLAPEYEQVIKTTGLTALSYSERSISKTISRKNLVEHTERQKLNDSSEIVESKHDHSVVAIKDLETLKLRRNRSIQPELMQDIGNVRVVHLLETLQQDIEILGKQNKDFESRVKILQNALDKKSDSVGRHYLDSLTNFKSQLENRLDGLTNQCNQIENEIERLNRNLAEELGMNHRLDMRVKQLKEKRAMASMSEARPDLDREQMMSVMRMKMLPSQAISEVVTGQLCKLLADPHSPDVQMLVARSTKLEQCLGI